MKERVHTLWGLIIGWIARLLYLSSLVALIPFFILLFTSPLVLLPETLQLVPFTAMGLLAVSILILFLYHRNLAHVLASMGWMTMIPGFAAVFFLIFNREAVFQLLASIVAGFGKVEPWVVSYLEHFLPHSWAFSVIYILVGFVLLKIARKIDHEHSLALQIKKLFGPRVRIFRS